MPPPRPIYRGQGNQPYPTARPEGPIQRGQTVAYDNNGAPTGGDAGTLDGHDTPYFLARANHTGTQLAATVSDFAEAVQDLVGLMLTNGAGITITYNDVAGTATVAFTGGVSDVSGLSAALAAKLDDSQAGTFGLALLAAADLAAAKASLAYSDTDLAGSAWAAWTPAVTSGSGTFTTVSAAGRYKQIGKTVFFRVYVDITTNGTAGSYTDITLPVASANVTAHAYQSVSGHEAGVTDFLIQGTIFNNSTTMRVQKYDATYIGGNGYVLALSGCYEAA